MRVSCMLALVALSGCVSLLPAEEPPADWSQAEPDLPFTLT